MRSNSNIWEFPMERGVVVVYKRFDEIHPNREYIIDSERRVSQINIKY